MATSTKKRPVPKQLASVQTSIHKWQITGISPLLQSNAAKVMEQQDKEAKDNQKRAIAGKKVYDDKEEAEIRVYRTDDGKHFYQPASTFRAAMCAGMSGRKFDKTQARYMISSCVFPVQEQCILLDYDGKPLTQYTLDKRPVVIKSGQKRNRILRVRPRFDEWMLNLLLEVDTVTMKLFQVTESLNVAGKLQGVGEFRPDPKDGKSGIGTFGRFIAELIE